MSTMSSARSRGATALAVAMSAAVLAALLPAQAAGRTFRIGITDFRNYYESTSCTAASTATEARSSARQISQERFKRGDCVWVRFIADSGGATTPLGQAPALDPSPTFEVRFLGEDGAAITTSEAALVPPVTPDLPANTDYYGAFVRIGPEWPAGDITVEVRPTRPGDTGLGRFKMSVNALGTRLLLEKPVYEPGENLVIRGVLWKDYHRITALTAQMSYPEDPQAKDAAEGEGLVAISAHCASGPCVPGEIRKPFRAESDGSFALTVPASEYTPYLGTPDQDFIRSLRLAATATYADPVTGEWETTAGDPDSIAFAHVQTTPRQAQVRSHFTSETGWVVPGTEYQHQIEYRNLGASEAAGVRIDDVLPPGAVFIGATPAPSSISGSTLTWDIGTVKAGSDWSGSRRIIVTARAKTEREDRTIVWKDLSSTATLTQNGKRAPASTTRGPKVTHLDTARFGTRPFPVVLVDYPDASHSDARPGWYFDQIINEELKDSTLATLYKEMSFGQLFPQGTVASLAAEDETFDAAESYKWATPRPKGACLGTTTITPNPGSDVSEGKPAGRRINGGWYRLPGTQSYYGGDEASYGEFILAVGGLPRLGIDGACGPTGKIAFDAASIADPDVDYNEYDPDRNGLVDFFMVVSRGLGGNGDSHVRGGYDAVWPHSSSLESYFVDENGQLGYVSHDQLRDKLERPLWWPDAKARKANDVSKLTTKDMGADLKAYVRVGPYNANPEVSSTSVIAHEYGHSLGLPDYYSSGSRRSVGYWDLMSTDYSQFMSAFSRQDLGWIVPRILSKGNLNVRLRESKSDIHEIRWADSAGNPYTLSGPDVHNADTYHIPLPYKTLLDKAHAGKYVWYSTAGNDFGCPGRTLDISLPILASADSGDTIKLKFKSMYEIEWDYDYGFVMVSEDEGGTFTTLQSAKSTTTPQGFNPNANGCQTQYGNGISGTSAAPSFPQNIPNRSAAGGELGIDYEDAVVIDDEFDLSAYAGKPVVLRFAYSTDAGLAKRGWFIDDIEVTNETSGVKYFTEGAEAQRTEMAPHGWTRLAAGPGNADHGYYVELRDRIGFDYDGRGQGDRVPIDWIPGVSLWFTDELRGYGNTGQSLGDPPNQTPIDSRPQKNSTAPRLQDASFWPLPGVNTYSDKGWVDNYQDGVDEKGATVPWTLKFSCFVMQVKDLRGLGSPGATAGLALSADTGKCRKTVSTAVGGTKTIKGPPGRPGKRPALPATGVGETSAAALGLALAALLLRRMGRRGHLRSTR